MNIIQKYRYQKLSRQAEKSLDGLIYRTEAIWSKLHSKKIYDYDKLFDVMIYSALASHDIRILVSLFVNEKTKRTQNLHGRHLCMLLTEFFDGINFLLGKNLRVSLEERGIFIYKEELKNLNKSFSNLKKQHSVELREIRNNASAHLSKDIKILIKHYRKLTITNDDLAKIAIEGWELSIILSELLNKIFVTIDQIASDRKTTVNIAKK